MIGLPFGLFILYIYGLQIFKIKKYPFTVLSHQCVFILLLTIRIQFDSKVLFIISLNLESTERISLFYQLF